MSDHKRKDAKCKHICKGLDKVEDNIIGLEVGISMSVQMLKGMN